MEIVNVCEMEQQEQARRVRSVFLNRTVLDCGHVRFDPHSVAHAGEEHRHKHDEVFVVLTGAIEVPGVGVARTGDWIFVKAGEEHHLTNRTDLPCTVIYLILSSNVKGNAT